MKFLQKDEVFSDIGQVVNCFYSFFLLKDKLFSVHRRHRLFSFDNWPKKQSDNLSQIVLTTYTNKNKFQIFSEEVLCDGNDPRVVSDGEKAYILSQGAIHTGVIYTLTILPERKNSLIKLGYGVELGKNWQPVINNKELFIIDSISPFRLNKLDINSGIVSKVEQVNVDFSLKASHDNYAILRGGTNAITQNDTIYGWGHATTKPYSHIPFIWEYNQNGVTTSFINIYSYFKNKGYNIVDPTCFFEWDNDHFALGLSCSQRDWFHSQWFLNALVLIKKSDFFSKQIKPLTTDIEARSIFFHTTELDSLIDSTIINGGRCSNGNKGCLVCGPSQEIDIDKKWSVELCYSSLSKDSRYVGEFDILLTIDGIDKKVASTKIYGTNGKSTRVKLTFNEIAKNSKALIQTRVFSSRRKIVNAYFFELTYGEE